MILYLHGLESSPNGNKGRYLSKKHGATAVDLDTSDAIALRDLSNQNGRRWTYSEPGMDRAFLTPMRRASSAVSSETQLIIGSSFGGAVLMNLIASGIWRGPSLFICPAVFKLTPHRALPGGFPLIILHGRQDTIIPISDSRALVETGGPGAMLWEIDDDHLMHRIIETKILDAAVDWLLSPEAQQLALSHSDK